MQEEDMIGKNKFMQLVLKKNAHFSLIEAKPDITADRTEEIKHLTWKTNQTLVIDYINQ